MKLIMASYIANYVVMASYKANYAMASSEANNVNS